MPLYIVATPIGNLEDFSPRARRILGSCHTLFAEDTRVARTLLTACGLPTPPALLATHDHNEVQIAKRELAAIAANPEHVAALITDRGTPAVSDPGFRLVQAARALGILVVPIPGPSAPMTLISAAGLPCDRWTMVGFLPPRRSALQRELRAWIQGTTRTYVAMTPARSLATVLTELHELAPNCQVALGRELTKLHEEIRVASPRDILIHWKARPPTERRGEVTLVVHLPDKAPQPVLGAVPGPQSDDDLDDRIIALYRQGMSTRDIVSALMTELPTPWRKQDLYNRVIRLRDTAPRRGDTP